LDRKIILNKLELAYAPMSSFEFSHSKEDPYIEYILEEASLYIIAQRPILTFEYVFPHYADHALTFEIHQKGNPNKLICKFPFFQKSLETSSKDTIAIAVDSLDKDTFEPKLPFKNLYGFSVVKQNDGVNKFIKWFSPEKLLQNWWAGLIDCEISGDYSSFLNYKVHYIGKATKQGVLKRLTGHSRFQDILSMENPITYKDLPAHEIAILYFKFNDNIQIQSFGGSSDMDEMKSSLLGENFPSQEKIFLDVEKALINAMGPKYNRELFKGYPKSKDGLYKDNYSYVSYSFVDPITLIYRNGEIRGSRKHDDADSIVIKENKEVSVVKMN